MRFRAPEPASGAPSAGGDIVPLSRRVAVLCVLRVTIGLAVSIIGFVSGELDSVSDLSAPLLFLLAGTAISGAVVSISHRPTSVVVFGLMLCLDGVAVVGAQEVLGAALGGDLVLALFLTAVCLLASFRTGVKLAFWLSLLLVIYDRGEQTGLFAPDPARDPDRLVAQLIMVWLLVIVTCGAAAVNERELRRRRYDAEALQSFASLLHEDETSERVIRRTINFFVTELDAGRILVCRSSSSGLQVVAGRGLATGMPPGQRRAGARPSGMSLLAIAGHAGQPARLLHLDPARDPWLAAQLPRARRLVVVPLSTSSDDDRVWIVFEHQGQGTRLERRIIATAGQAGATSGLALSRAILVERSKAAALTDALTGLSNRRCLDDRLAGLNTAGAQYAVMLVDVDHFKAVNDTHGHQIGDEVLQQVATALAGAAPTGAIVARYGGEEFAVVLTAGLATPELAAGAAERLRQAIEDITAPVPVTASFGLAFGSGPARTADVVAAADAGLYQAKAAGRNQVVVMTGVHPDVRG